eukprot:2156154-Lingulodinium_polyedra.AAC.1
MDAGLLHAPALEQERPLPRARAADSCVYARVRLNPFGQTVGQVGRRDSEGLAQGLPRSLGN